MKNLMYKISLLIFGLVATVALQAQDKFSGVVKDTQGEPLVGVSVFVDGTTLGVTTDADGKYEIDIPEAKGKVLVFSMIGLRTQSVTIGNSNVIDVVLEEDTNFLEETVVIGYATVKRKDLMGSVSSVDSETLAAMPVTTVTEALSGRMAGVQVTTTEGDPDAEVKIRVRGGGSITQDSSPLYIVDGFPVESISDIAASDIESIDVLKDAFSTAIYGSRGANGVVLVTTKSGTKGKISASYNVYWGQKWMANKDAIQVEDPYNFVKNQYEIGMVRGDIKDKFIPTFGVFEDISLYEGIQGNDWIDAVFGNTGRVFSQNISVSGSSDKVRWTASYTHLGDNAIMTGSTYRRDNLNFKTNYKPIKQLSFDINARYSGTQIRGAGANSINDGGTTSNNGRLKHAVQYTPIPLEGAVEGAELEEDYGDTAPPLTSVADNDNRRSRRNWTVNAAVTWHIIDNLNLKIEGGYDDYTQENDRYYGLTTYYVAETAQDAYKNHPAVQRQEQFRRKIRNTNTLSYNFAEVFTDSRHHLDLLAGTEYILTKSNNLTAVVQNYPDFFDAETAWNFMSTGAAVSVNNYFNPNDKLLSFFGRVNYIFDERYSVSATVRADGSSKFSKGNQWGVFPSAAVSWTISNEPWMKGASRWLDNLKLRYSFGTAGNNNIPSGMTMLNFTSYSGDGVYIPMSNIYWSTVTDGGDPVMANEDLTWETTRSHNVGIDFSFLKSRVNGSIELYHNTTDDLLISFPIAGSGYEYQYRNMGKTQNRGVEFSINAALVAKENFGLTLGANISLNQNEVLSLGDLDKIDMTTRWASTEVGPDFIVMAGQPLGNIYGFESDGFYKVEDFTYDPANQSYTLKKGIADASSYIGSNYLRPGAMKLKDQDGDGVITEKDRKIIGNTLPLGSGGITLSGYLYGIDFSANFNYVFGNDIYNANKIEFTSSRKYERRNLMKTGEQRWTNINWETGEFLSPEELETVNANATLWSPAVGQAVLTDWAVEDGSFLRLSSATIGYTLPSHITMKAKISRLRFYVTGTNLFCLTNYSGYDPEVDTRRDTPLTPGVDYSAYPKSIGFVVGANITF